MALEYGTQSPTRMYTPGATYEIVVGGINTNQLRRFGFQATCVKKDSTNVQAGTFTSTRSDISVRTNTHPNLVEHNTSIDHENGSVEIYVAKFNWTAPPAGTGPVLFFATLAAVDGTGGAGGDQPSTLGDPVELSEASTSVKTVPLTSLKLFPNPAFETIHAQLDRMNGSTYTVAVYNMAGKTLLSKSAFPVNGVLSISVTQLPPGMYQLVAQQGSGRYSAPFFKQ